MCIDLMAILLYKNQSIYWRNAQHIINFFLVLSDTVHITSGGYQRTGPTKHHSLPLAIKSNENNNTLESVLACLSIKTYFYTENCHLNS